MPADPIPPRPTVLTGARIFDGERFLDGARVRIEQSRIAAIDSRDAATADGEIVDLGGGCLAPGFVDVQVNGGGGVLFNADPSSEGLRTIARAHRRFGTTSLLATLISDDWKVMRQAADAVGQALAQAVPGLRGIHFEGPYLSPARRGIHRESAIRPPDADALALFSGGGLGSVVVTVAPEAVPADFIAALAAAGIRVCAGHSAADYDTVRAALAAGLTGFTHLFNAMPPLSARAPGILGAALEDADSWCGVIVDGHHVHPASLRLALRSKPPGRVMLVTDAMPCVGSTEPRFLLDGQWIEVSEGRCSNADGTLAGSALDMASAVRNSVDLLGLPLAEALRMASLYPAAFLGLDHRIGRIAAGFDADLVLFDDDLKVRATWIGGARQDHD